MLRTYWQRNLVSGFAGLAGIGSSATRNWSWSFMLPCLPTRSYANYSCHSHKRESWITFAIPKVLWNTLFYLGRSKKSSTGKICPILKDATNDFPPKWGQNWKREAFVNKNGTIIPLLRRGKKKKPHRTHSGIVQLTCIPHFHTYFKSFTPNNLQCCKLFLFLYGNGEYKP